MENAEYNNKVELTSKSMVPFVIGMILAVATVVMFFVGTFAAVNQSPLWIATAVVGGISLLLLAISGHSTDGWVRMFSILFIIAITVMLTFMATITWA